MLRGCHEIKIANFDYPIFCEKKKGKRENKRGEWGKCLAKKKKGKVGKKRGVRLLG